MTTPNSKRGYLLTSVLAATVIYTLVLNFESSHELVSFEPKLATIDAAASWSRAIKTSLGAAARDENGGVETWHCTNNTVSAKWLCTEGRYVHDAVNRIGTNVFRFIGLKYNSSFESGMDLGCAHEFSGEIFFDETRNVLWQVDQGPLQSNASPNRTKAKKVIVHPTKSSSQNREKCKICPVGCTTIAYQEDACKRVCENSHKGMEYTKACWQCVHWRHNIYISSDKTLLEKNELLQSLWPMHELNFLETVLQTLVDDPKNLESMFQDKRHSKSRSSGISSISKSFLDQVVAKLSKQRVRGDRSFNAGGGGGAGLQIKCNGVVRVSIGGGGGAGLARTSGSQKSGSVGTGFGAGVQLFDQDGKEMLSAGGGGGGGGLLQHSKHHRWKVGKADFGSAMDDDSLVNFTNYSWQQRVGGESVNREYVKQVVQTVRQSVRECFERGNATVTGGGGAGSGASSAGNIQNVNLSFGGITAEFRYIANSCPFGCAQRQTMTQTPFAKSNDQESSDNKPSSESNSDSCKYSEMKDVFSSCTKVASWSCKVDGVHHTDQQGSYQRCVCPCLKESFKRLNCEWANHMACQT